MKLKRKMKKKKTQNTVIYTRVRQCILKGTVF